MRLTLARNDNEPNSSYIYNTYTTYIHSHSDTHRLCVELDLEKNACYQNTKKQKNTKNFKESHTNAKP